MTPDDHILSPIDRHLRHDNQLVNEDLIAELTDHYVVGISERMAQGLSFDVALQDMYANFGGRKGLRTMEQHYNRITMSHYNQIWLECIREQLRWPGLIIPLFLFGFIYGVWMLLTNSFSNPVSVDRLTNSWNGFAFGSIGGLFIQFIRQLYLHRRGLPNVSPQAWYVLTRLLPLSVFLCAFPFILPYLAPYMAAGFYYVSLVLWLFVVIALMLSYIQFYKVVLKTSRRTAS
jgi:hypothetical protein